MYHVKFYKGDYRQRQEQANEDQCIGYVEQHFNSSDNREAGYSVVVVGSNASQTSKNWGRWYAAAVAREFSGSVGGDNGILVGGYNGRGDANLRYTDMPAILLEPLFCSNPSQAGAIKGAAGQDRLARILCDSIQRFFQKGGLLGFSVGHKYKTSHPDDRGAAIAGGGWEADCAEAVLNKAATMLSQIREPSPAAREIRIVEKGNVIASHSIDPDADVVWDPVRGVLLIN
jgi:hypothetical protein